MKRKGLALAVVATALLSAAGGTAGAFEQTTEACSIAEGSASVGLDVTGGPILGGTFTVTGTVECQGATAVEIHHLRLRRLVPNPLTPGTRVNAGTSHCAFPCSDPVVATGTSPALPGLFEVFMRFTATGPGGTYVVVRQTQFAWAGIGSPIAVCDGPECPLATDH